MASVKFIALFMLEFKRAAPFLNTSLFVNGSIFVICSFGIVVKMLLLHKRENKSAFSGKRERLFRSEG